MHKHVVVMLGLLASCAEEAPPADRSFGATCTTVSDTSTAECDSGVCTDAFDMIGHPVCSQKCPAGDGTTCPVGADGTMKCNMKGYCKP
ncbi:MAG: hypothetical protein NT062_37900 [Proteobacteria bacterium]|nr:hypothetical protein [Pseudomonadota bacterium]